MTLANMGKVVQHDQEPTGSLYQC